MINEEQHIALPKLYGAPAYGRPPRAVVEAAPRPPDPDDLPLEVFRTFGDPSGSNGGSGELPVPHTNGSGNGGVAVAEGEPRLEGRPFSLRSLSRFISRR